MSSVLAVRTKRSAKQFAPRASRWDLHGVDAGAGQEGVERCGELAGAVADEEPEGGGAVVEVDQQEGEEDSADDVPDEAGGGRRPLRFQNSATVADLRFQAARSYSLISPPSTGRRLIRWQERLRAG